MTEFADVDALLAGYQQRGGQPGLVYGVVSGGDLVHARGFGERRLGGPEPDVDTVFRIASMTKSFTAASVLTLRDEGALALDDLAEEYVPELRGWPPVTADAAQVSIRQLLTMTAGFPTDDPWGDRQQSMPLDDFGKFLAGGVSFAWAPGTRFEYSNLGYAILGRIVAAVSGVPYRDFVRDRLLGPLGMTRTGYEADEVTAPDGLAHGYRRAPSGWEEVPVEPYGAFAPMGGLFSCVSDLARWVAGFAAAFPPADDEAGPHPLRRASRREMQLPQVPTGWDHPASFPPSGAVTAYGFGLSVEGETALGRVAGHGGGYPGFGSYMRWHQATGTGVIALANSTYARMGPLTARILELILRSRPQASTVALAPAGRVWPRTLAARDVVNGLLESWDDETADRLFTPNVRQDTPYAERRTAIARIRERIGDFRPARTPAEHDSPAHCRWWLAGEHGVVQAQILLTPERPPRVQSLTLAVPPAPGSPLQRTVDKVVAWLNGGEAVPVAAGADAGGIDPATLGRSVRAAAAWAGRCTPGAWSAGNGTGSAAVELTGEHANLTLTVTVAPTSGELRHAEISCR
jgi:CubicO group peptidase (beta-lactamase class C family)